MKTYREKLLDPRWQRLRLEKLQDQDFACEACGDTKTTLHVHHPKYIKGREPWEYSLAELEVLCADCHAEHHDREQAIAEVVRSPFVHDMLSLAAGYFYGSGVVGQFVGLLRHAGATDFWHGFLAFQIHRATPEVRAEVHRLLVYEAERPSWISAEKWADAIAELKYQEARTP